jgi:hypothetical protein
MAKTAGFWVGQFLMARELLESYRTATDSDSTIMDAFSPELAEHWLASQAMSADERPGGRDEDSLSPAQQEAWEELAERVTAARSIY